MEESVALERAQLANQIQGFRIPYCWVAIFIIIIIIIIIIIVIKIVSSNS